MNSLRTSLFPDCSSEATARLRSRRFLPLILIGLVLSLASVSVYGQGAAKLLEDGQVALSRNQFEQAAQLFEQMNDYKTSEAYPQSQLLLAYCQLQLQKFDEAIAKFEEVQKMRNASPEILEFAQSYLAQAHLSYALSIDGEEDGNESKVNDQLTKANAAYDKLLETYPETEQKESALYGKGIALYFLEKYEESAESLTRTRNEFPQSEAIGETLYLLSIAKASRAGQLVREDDSEANRQQAIALYSEALEILEEILELTGLQRSIALINDVRFQIGEVNFNIGVLQEGDAQAERFAAAINAYRQVGPKEPMIEAQNERIEVFQKRYVEAIGTPQEERWRDLRDREQSKLRELQDKPPQTIEAKVREARIYLIEQDYNRSRVLAKFLERFEMTEEQAKNVRYLIGASYASQAMKESALQYYEIFKENHGGDPAGANLPLLIGNIFLQPANLDPQKAIEYFDEGLETYPEGPFLTNTIAAKANALIQLGQTEEASKLFQQALEKDPSEALVPTIKLGLANALFASQKYEESLPEYRSIQEQFPDSTVGQEAKFREAVSLQVLNRLEESNQVLDNFMEEYPDSQLVPQVRFTRAINLNNLGQTDAALETLKEIAEEYPDTEEGERAMISQAEIMASIDPPRFEEAEALLVEFTEKYPDSNFIAAAYNLRSNIKGQFEDYVAMAEIWDEFYAEYPDHNLAALALLQEGDFWRVAAGRLGGYRSLDSEKRELWKNYVRNGIEAADTVILEKSESPYIGQALSLSLDLRKDEVLNRIYTWDDVILQYEALANDISASSIEARLQVRFALASALYDAIPRVADPAEKEDLKEKAFELWGDYDAGINYPEKDMIIYGLALIDEKRLSEAEAVFQRVQNQPAVSQTGAGTGQAEALYGLGKVALEKGELNNAQNLFNQYLVDAPDGEYREEAQFGIATVNIKDGKFDEAEKIADDLSRIRDRTRISNELRGNLLLLQGKVFIGKGQFETAINYLRKVPVGYEAFPEIVAESYDLLSKLYSSSGKPAEAERMRDGLEQLLNEHEDEPWVADYLGGEAGGDGDGEEASEGEG